MQMKFNFNFELDPIKKISETAAAQNIFRFIGYLQLHCIKFYLSIDKIIELLDEYFLNGIQISNCNVESGADKQSEIVQLISYCKLL
jgi:hypothetical protein